MHTWVKTLGKVSALSASLIKDAIALWRPDVPNIILIVGYFKLQSKPKEPPHLIVRKVIP